MKLILFLFLLQSTLYATAIGGGGNTATTGSEFFTGSGSFSAKVTSDGELAVTSTERERNVYAAFSAVGVATTTYYALIDLSDTTNFPHDQTGRIDLSVISIDIDRDNTATGQLDIGVITRVDGTDADISYLITTNFSKSDVLHIDNVYNIAPSQVKFGQSGGVLTRAVTSNSEDDQAAVNTGDPLDSPTGVNTVTPAVGDIILRATRAAGSYDFTVAVLYHGELSAN